MKKSLSFGVLILVLFAGCGGGIDGGFLNDLNIVQANAGGLWVGTSSIGATTIDIEGVITEEYGEGRFVDENGTQYVITSVVIFDTDIAIRFDAYAQFGYVFADGSTSATGTITGTVSERSSLRGSFSLSTGETGSVAFTYDPLYERDSSIPKLVGQWDDSFGILTVNSDGTFFEQDQFGCIYDGQASIIDPSYNAYRLTMTVSNCETSDGTFGGLAVLGDLDAANDENLLVVQMNSDSVIFTAFLARL